MRVAAITEDRGLVEVVREVPDPGPEEVRIDVAYCGLCGSDLHMLHGQLTPAGFVLGHEFSGTVNAVGEGVAEVTVGQRVTAMALAGCGQCPACELGHLSSCPSAMGRGPGLGRPGALASQVLVSADVVIALPDEVDDQAGALAEPLAVAVRAVALADLAEAGPRARAIVVGAGPVGLLVAEVLRARQVSDVLVIEPRANRRRLAAGLGWQVVAPEDAEPLPEGSRVLAFDCSGHPDAFARVQELLPVGARIVVVGVPSEPVQLNALQVVVKEWTVRGSVGYARHDMEEAIALLAAGRIRSELLITRVVDLADADAAVHDLTNPDTTNIKTLVRPAGPPAG